MATVIFCIPHQDDDSLTMGAAIRNHINAGHDVHTVLMTSGLGSVIQQQIGLSDSDFAAARDDEYARAVRQLGVRPGNIHFAPDRVTTATPLTQALSEQIITEYAVNMFPGAWVKSYSQLDVPGRNPDHVQCGLAAVALLAAGAIANLRLYVEPWMRSAYASAFPGTAIQTETISDTSPVTRAYAQYQLQDHIGGMWGIGYLSVGPDFTANTPPHSYYHLPPA